jgi:hypothetical protein
MLCSKVQRKKVEDAVNMPNGDILQFWGPGNTFTMSLKDEDEWIKQKERKKNHSGQS